MKNLHKYPEDIEFNDNLYIKDRGRIDVNKLEYLCNLGGEELFVQDIDEEPPAILYLMDEYADCIPYLIKKRDIIWYNDDNHIRKGLIELCKDYLINTKGLKRSKKFKVFLKQYREMLKEIENLDNYNPSMGIDRKMFRLKLKIDDFNKHKIYRRKFKKEISETLKPIKNYIGDFIMYINYNEW